MQVFYYRAIFPAFSNVKKLVSYSFIQTEIDIFEMRMPLAYSKHLVFTATIYDICTIIFWATGCALVVHLALLWIDADIYMKTLTPFSEDGEVSRLVPVHIGNFLLLIMSGSWLVAFHAKRREAGDLIFLRYLLIFIVLHGVTYLIFYRFFDIPVESESASNILAWSCVIIAFWASGLFLVTGRHCWPAYICAGVWFVLAGEEISWGQWIIGWSTPPIFEGNLQNETNLHNYFNLVFEYLYIIVFALGWLCLTERAQRLIEYLPPVIGDGILSVQKLARRKFLDLFMLWMLACRIIRVPGIFSADEYVEQLFAVFGFALAIALYKEYSTTKKVHVHKR